MINRNGGTPQPINSGYSNTNNTFNNINLSIDRIEIAKETMNFLMPFPRIHAILVKPNEKIPLEPDWQHKNNYPVTSTYVLNHLIRGGNYGLMHPAGMSVGIDDDNDEIRKIVLSLGNTFSYNTGKQGHFCDIFIIEDEPVGNIPLIDGAYIRGKGGQNLGPGSIHPNGNIYGSTYFNLVPPLKIKKSELLEKFAPVIIGKEKLSKNESEPEYKKPVNPDSLTMKDLVDFSGFKQNGSKFQGAHPVHGSSTGSNFLVDLDLNAWHCFRHGTGGGPLQWIAVSTGVIGCEESNPGKIKGDVFWRTIAAAHNQYGLSYDRLAEALGGAYNDKQ